MPRAKPIRMPSDAEEAEIQAMIASDPENPEWTEEDFAKARPFAEVHPELAASYRRTRRAQKTPTKKPISLRLDPDVIEHFRATGPGWQSRINDALRKIMSEEGDPGETTRRDSSDPTASTAE